MIVSYIDELGFIKVGNCGGVDSRLLSSQKVIIHTKNGPINGIVTSKPPHLTNLTDNQSALDISDVIIDVGYNYSETSNLVELGDRVTFDSCFGELLNNQVFGKSFDNRAGVLSILNTLDMIKSAEFELKAGLTVVFSTQEELGNRGAIVSSNKLDPDIAIIVDVSFAYTKNCKVEQCGKIDHGAMIGISPIISNNISQQLIKIAKSRNIPYQLEVMSGKTSTNADVYSISNNKIHTGLISIPLKYMHTPVEVVSMNDISYVSDILFNFIMDSSI